MFRSITKIAAAAALTLGVFTSAVHAQTPAKTITLDYAYYNPVSLILKQKGLLEQEFKKDGIEVKWVLSAGSNKALEYLRGNAVDFGSTAGSAALVAKANGAEIKSIYIYSKPEWTALVTRPDTNIKKVADLKGKSIAVTKGTDPHIFLLRALSEAKLTDKDVNLVLLQHADGERALGTKQVDAWAGLDPFMAKAEVESGALLFHRKPDYNTYGVLNVREAFLKENPALVERVLKVYEAARKEALADKKILVAALVQEAKLAEPVAQKQINERTDITNPQVSDKVTGTLEAAGAALKDIGILKPETDVKALVASLLDPSITKKVTGGK